MKQYSTFHFSGYSWNHHAGKISLKYSLDREVDFEEIILLPEPVTDERLKAKEWEIERSLFALHLIGGISYFKTCLPKTIAVESGGLSREGVKFWNAVYENGLGEFFFQNDIDFRGRIKFPEGRVDGRPKPAMQKRQEENPLHRILVPIGGGKDSIVTAQLLKKAKANITLLRMEPHPLIDEVAATAGLPMLGVRRMLSPNLFELNKQGALNGHVPITAYLSILSVLLALLYDYDAVAMSNERSANVGNVEYRGLVVNHQWSKSAEFERIFRRYVSASIGTNIEYFSALRPFSELRISELFCTMPQYFEKCTSCNKNWKIVRTAPAVDAAASLQGTNVKSALWCKKCPKCAFVFSCLAAFLPREELLKIFGGNFYEDVELLPLYRELLGLEKFKPFECVGTPEETIAAFLLAKKRGEMKDTVAMKMFESEALPTIKDPDALIASALKPSKEHFIPKNLQSILA